MGWSYTSLTAFETCPRRYYHTRVAKDVVEPETEALTWGNAVHKALEKRVLVNVPLPTGMTQWEGLVDRLLKVPGSVFAERKLAFDRNLKQTSWFDKAAWVRGIIDVGIIQPTTVIALDYKTGKPKPDSDQLRLFAALLFAAHQASEIVKTGFLWLQTNEVTKEEFKREQVTDIWNTFIPRVAKLEDAHSNNDWPVRPSGLCRNWCPCTQCEYNGKKQL